jgi:hypothetical protein
MRRIDPLSELNRISVPVDIHHYLAKAYALGLVSDGRGSRVQRLFQKGLERVPRRIEVATRIVAEQTLLDERGDLGFMQLNRHAAQPVPPLLAMPAHSKSRSSLS